MKKIIISLMILSMLTACAGAVAEAPRNGGRGNGSGGGSMQTLNEGIAYMNGDGVDQDYEKALELFMEAFEAGSMKAARLPPTLSSFTERSEIIAGWTISSRKTAVQAS